MLPILELNFHSHRRGSLLGSAPIDMWRNVVGGGGGGRRRRNTWQNCLIAVLAISGNFSHFLLNQGARRVPNFFGGSWNPNIFWIRSPCQILEPYNHPFLEKKSKELRVGEKRNDAFYNGHFVTHTLCSDQYFILLPVEDKPANSTPFRIWLVWCERKSCLRSYSVCLCCHLQQQF